MVLSQPACRLLSDFFQFFFSVAIHAVQANKVLCFVRRRRQNQVPPVSVLIRTLVSVVGDGAASTWYMILQALHLIERLLSII